MTINPNALRVVTDVDADGVMIHETVMLGACHDCGSIVYDPDTHERNCPRIQPPHPPPIPENLGALLLRHRAAGCETCSFPPNHVVWADHLHDVVAAIVDGAQ